jgi:hypothetical protein
MKSSQNIHINIAKNKKRSKKAQVMAFVIVAILLLGVFGFLYYVSSLKKDSELDGAQTTTINRIQTTSSELLVVLEECLQVSADDALYSAGQQSGLIYTNQFGFDAVPHSIPFEIDGVVRRVPFGLTRVDNELAPPAYPIAHPDGHRYGISYVETNFAGRNVWGKVNLPKLCDQFGPNGAQDFEPATCNDFAMGFGNFTIQNKLKYATLDATYRCLEANKNLIDDKTRSFIISQTDLEVLFTDSSVRFSLFLKATAQLDGINLNIQGVTYNAPVRLKRIYNLAHEILRFDSSDIRFNKERDYVDIGTCNYDDGIQCYDEHMYVAVYRNVHEQFPGDDILYIIDNRSTINGRPYVFATAIENRPPMLDYYRESTSVSDRTIDIYRDTTDDLLLLPQAFDPDEDTLQINYYGFKSIGLNASSIYKDIATYEKHCAGRQNWCAEYIFNNFKPSVREFRMEVCDPYGLCDYQDIRIQIGQVDYTKMSFCPTWLAPTKTGTRTSCEIGTASCRCEAGQFCHFTNEVRPVVCSEGSLCCQTITDPALVSSTLRCESGSECYQSVPQTTGSITCQSGSSCFQETVSGTVTQNCDKGTTCYQEVVSGSGSSDCRGNCRQENDFGTISQSCTGTANTNTQGNTVLTCANS